MRSLGALSVLFVFLSTSILLLFSFPGSGNGKTLTALEIMRRVDLKETGRTVSSTTEMILIGSDGQKRTRKMKSFTKHENSVTRKIIFLLGPPEVKGTALLTYDYLSDDLEDEQWIYLPSLHRTKRISAGNRGGSFMGSDFSYGDFTRKSLDAYSYTLLKEQVQDGHQVWIIEALPRDDETIRLYGYTKSLLIVRQDNLVIVRAIHWLKDKNTLKYYEIKNLEQHENIWIPLEIHAKTVSNRKIIHQTMIINRDITLNQPMEDELFTRRKMERGL